MKNSRHEAICNIIRKNNVQTQKQLADFLRREGFTVTQTTVSRDINELQLVKVPAGDDGYRYTLPGGNHETSEYTDVFAKNVLYAKYAGNNVVIKTVACTALLTAQAIDALGYSYVLGTVAGYDTVLVVTETENKSAQLVKEISEFANTDSRKG